MYVLVGWNKMKQKDGKINIGKDLSCPYCNCRFIKQCAYKKGYYECLECHRIYNKEDVLKGREV